MPTPCFISVAQSMYEVLVRPANLSRCGPEARVPRRFAQRGLTGFDNVKEDAGQRPAYPGALRFGAHWDTR